MDKKEMASLLDTLDRVKFELEKQDLMIDELRKVVCKLEADNHELKKRDSNDVFDSFINQGRVFYYKGARITEEHKHLIYMFMDALILNSVQKSERKKQE